MKEEADHQNRKNKLLLFTLLVVALIPSLCGLLLLKIDPHGGEKVTILFLLVNLFCSIVTGVGVARLRQTKDWVRVVVGFAASTVLFFINWAFLIFVDLIWFDPIRW